MTSHTPSFDISPDQTPLPNQSFSPWLRGQTALFISQIGAILGFILFLATLVYYVSSLGKQSGWLSPENVRLFIDYTHIVFIAVFILALIQVLDDNDRGSHRVKLVYERVFNKHEGDYERSLETSKEQLKKFKRRFLWFWIGMLFLYVSFACQHSYQLVTSKPPEKSTQSVITSVLVTTKSPDGKEETSKIEVNSGTTDKSKNSTPESEPPAPEPLNSYWDITEKLVLKFLPFLFNNITLLSIFWCFLVLYIPPEETKRDRKFFYGSIIIVGVLTLLYPLLVPVKGRGFTANDWYAYSAIFDALSGVINAIVLALLIARLDSKLIGLPSWLICILYSYAAVQPLFLVFDLSDSDVLKEITTSVLIFVFVSKVYFFLIIIYALQTGKMLNYLFCFPVLRKRARLRKLRVDKRSKPAQKPRKKYAFLSRWLRSDYPLIISKWLGLAAICYFFISLLASQVIPKRAVSDGGIRDAVFNWVSYIPVMSNVTVDYAQLVVVSGVILILWLIRNDNGYGVRRVPIIAKRIFKEPLESNYPPHEGKEQLKKFKIYFLYFWVATLVLYIILLLDHKRIYVPPGEEHSIASMFNVMLYPFLKFLLSSLNLMFIYWCFVVLQSPAFDEKSEKRQKLLVRYSVFVTVLLVAVYLLLFFRLTGPALSKEQMEAYATVFDGIVGTLSAVVLALLIARMDSKIFGLPSWSWATRILFVYASIQPLFIAFNQKAEVLKAVQTAVLTAALGLKICFFLIVAHSLQSGKVFNYLFCFPFLKERVNSIFENQFEIKLAKADHNLFTFSILKKNQPYYSTSKRLESRKECDKYVRDLRTRMKERAAYFPPPPREESGTYWIEVRSVDGDLICESIPLKSKEEVDELINESIGKIPYCKYNRT